MKKRKTKDKKYLDQIDLKGILEQRARFEKRIIELGGKIPKPRYWPDRSGVLRNLQLLERVEGLERKRNNTNTSSKTGSSNDRADVIIDPLKPVPRRTHL